MGLEWECENSNRNTTVFPPEGYLHSTLTSTTYTDIRPSWNKLDACYWMLSNLFQAEVSEAGGWWTTLVTMVTVER